MAKPRDCKDRKKATHTERGWKNQMENSHANYTVRSGKHLGGVQGPDEIEQRK